MAVRRIPHGSTDEARAAFFWFEDSELPLVDERQQLVLRLRSGMDDDGPLTLAEVGERLGVGRERVRAIQNAALGKIRRHRAAEQASFRGRAPIGGQLGKKSRAGHSPIGARPR